eukprot:TRINITY_DN36227_c0_g1_i1.p2 TRINITY_DN36227_c0_g1~~TRINITY_DN36227_c0_g1_i1.p2  ORF type:complete len:284 (+),score=87.82 TRINITY_DN36227_c0_g1_i1:76-927(+)
MDAAQAAEHTAPLLSALGLLASAAVWWCTAAVHRGSTASALAFAAAGTAGAAYAAAALGYGGDVDEGTNWLRELARVLTTPLALGALLLAEPRPSQMADCGIAYILLNATGMAAAVSAAAYVRDAGYMLPLWIACGIAALQWVAVVHTLCAAAAKEFVPGAFRVAAAVASAAWLVRLLLLFMDSGGGGMGAAVSSAQAATDVVFNISVCGCAVVCDEPAPLGGSPGMMPLAGGALRSATTEPLPYGTFHPAPPAQSVYSGAGGLFQPGLMTDAASTVAPRYGR